MPAPSLLPSPNRRRSRQYTVPWAALVFGWAAAFQSAVMPAAAAPIPSYVRLPEDVRAEVRALDRARGPAMGRLSQAHLRRLAGSLPRPPSRKGQLYFAVASADLALFDALVGGSRPEGAHDPETGMTALMIAAEIGQWDAATRLVRLVKGEDGQFEFRCDYGDPYYKHRCDRFGYTALMHAASSGQTEIVNYLLNAGAPPDKRCYVARFDALQLAQNNRHNLAAAALQRRLDALEQQRREEERLREERDLQFLRPGWWRNMVMHNGDLFASIFVAVLISLGGFLFVHVTVRGMIGRDRRELLVGLLTRAFVEESGRDPAAAGWSYSEIERSVRTFVGELRWRRDFMTRWHPAHWPPSFDQVVGIARDYQKETTDHVRKTLRPSGTPVSGTPSGGGQ